MVFVYNPIDFIFLITLIDLGCAKEYELCILIYIKQTSSFFFFLFTELFTESFEFFYADERNNGG